METLRPLLTTYAYNILGSLDEAKDIVQDAFINFIKVDREKIANEKAYLVRSVINLSINRKKKQQRVVADYPGEWLPEPIATETADAGINQKEILNYSLMVLLEKLNAKQRAVFILKEAFDYEHEEIAEVLDISPENSRKILSRARVQLQMNKDVDERSVSTDQLDKYIHVITTGDTNRLEKLLADDISVVSDGGGKAAAFRNPINGREDVTSLLIGLQKKYYKSVRFSKGEINHQPALFHYDGDKLVTCQIFSFTGDRLDHIFFIRNPDKLRNLEAVNSQA